MGQKLLTLRVRPARILVLVSSASSPADFLVIVRFLSQIWGGQFNHILAVDRDTPDPLTEFRLSTNRPDFVFGLNLNDAVWGPAVHKACQPREYLPLSQDLAS